MKFKNSLTDYLNDKYSQLYVNEKLVGKENEFILPIVYKKFKSTKTLNDKIIFVVNYSYK